MDGHSEDDPRTARVRVVRGRAASPDADRDVTAAMLDRAGETGVPAFRAWTPHRQVAFGRRDVRADGYDGARRAAEERGFPAVERSVGGRAVAYTGTTVAFARAVPTDASRSGLDARYEDATTRVVRALRSLGVPARRGEPPESFCPGDHSVQAHGKLCGLAQRVRREAALVSGVVVVADHQEQAAVLDPVYEALSVPFDPASVGSVARAGGPADADRVVAALESAFVGDAPARVDDVASPARGDDRRERDRDASNRGA
jgi:lipoate-protein ligase A